MAERDQRRKSTDHAWFITGPWRCSPSSSCTAISVISDRPYGDWGLAFLFFLAMAGISIPVLNFVVRRQSVGVTLTGDPTGGGAVLPAAADGRPDLHVRRAGLQRLAALRTGQVLVQRRRGPRRPRRWPACVLLALPPLHGVGPRAPGPASSLAVNTITLFSLRLGGRRTCPSAGLAGRPRGAADRLRRCSSPPSINASVGLLVADRVAQRPGGRRCCWRPCSSRSPWSTARTPSSSGSTAR